MQVKLQIATPIFALQVEQLHAEVVEQVKSLYYSHRHLHGWQERELEIV